MIYLLLFLAYATGVTLEYLRHEGYRLWWLYALPFAIVIRIVKATMGG